MGLAIGLVILALGGWIVAACAGSALATAKVRIAVLESDARQRRSFSDHVADAVALAKAERNATIQRTISHRVQHVHGIHGPATWAEPTIEDLELMPTRPLSVAATLVER